MAPSDPTTVSYALCAHVDGLTHRLGFFLCIISVTKSIKSVQKEIIIKSPVALLTPGVILKAAASANIGLKEKSNCSDTLYQNTSSSSNDDSMLTRLRNRLQKIFPSDFGVIHVGIILAIGLALFSCFLMYKIHYLQTRMYSFNDLRWVNLQTVV